MSTHTHKYTHVGGFCIRSLLYNTVFLLNNVFILMYFTIKTTSETKRLSRWNMETKTSTCHYKLSLWCEHFYLYHVQVQIQLTTCYSDKAFCACGIAVRAGADVFIINFCDGWSVIQYAACEYAPVLRVSKMNSNNQHYRVCMHVNEISLLIEISDLSLNNWMNWWSWILK